MFEFIPKLFGTSKKEKEELPETVEAAAQKAVDENQKKCEEILQFVKNFLKTKIQQKITEKRELNFEISKFELNVSANHFPYKGDDKKTKEEQKKLAVFAEMANTNPAFFEEGLKNEKICFKINPIDNIKVGDQIVSWTINFKGI